VVFDRLYKFNSFVSFDMTSSPFFFEGCTKGEGNLFSLSNQWSTSACDFQPKKFLQLLSLVNVGRNLEPIASALAAHGLCSVALAQRPDK
jgi:hypothetical protein